jgi:hypothetical protein
MANGDRNQEDRITHEDVQGRRDAISLAQTSVAHATSVARAVRHPWYRCQALAEVAKRAAERELRESLLAEAVAAAFEQDQPNRVACVARWPLCVMVRTESPQASRLVKRLLDVIATEPHGLRRLDGLAAIVGPLLEFPSLRTRAWDCFEATARQSSGWRTERIVAWMAVSMATHDRKAALNLLAGRGENRFATKARAAIASQKPPRPA